MHPSQPLIGRRNLVSELRARLAQDGALVALVGPPGVGKTAVARAAVADLPAIWCDCDRVRAPAGLQQALAAALGVPVSDDSDDALGWALAAVGPVSVVLDGVDLVAAELGGLLERWGTLAPRARFLLTSRRRPVFGGAILELDALDAADAETLFRERAGERALSGTQDERTLGALLDKLDGLPLAIELAAARLRVLSVAALSQRVGLDLLRDDQRSLRGAISASWAPLEPPMRAALALCALFEGPFALEDLEALAGPALDPVLALVEALLDRSLLRWAPGPEGPRFELLRSVRDFVLEQLPADAAITSRFHQHTLARADTAAGLLRGRDASQGVGQLQRLSGALVRVVEEGGPDERTRATLLLGELAESTGPLVPHLARVRAALAEHPEPADRASLVLSACRALRPLRQHQQVAELLAGVEELVGLLDLGDTDPQRAATLQAGLWCAVGTNQVDLYALEEGEATLARAVEAFRGLGDAAGEAGALRRLATATLFQGDLGGAAEHLSRGLALSRRCGDLRLEALVLSSLGLLERHRISPTLSEAFFRQALRLHGLMGDLRLEAAITGFLGLTLWDQGRLDDAGQVLERGVGICQRVGDRAGQASALGALEAIRVEAGVAAADRARLEGVVARLSGQLEQRWSGERDRALLTATIGFALHGLGRRSDAIVRYRQAVPSLEASGARAQSCTVRTCWAVACTDPELAAAVLEAGRATRPNTAEHRLLASVATQVIGHGFVAAPLRDQVERSARGYARLLLHFADDLWGAARIAADGTWFQTPASGRVDLVRKRVLRRLLAVLVDRHARAPASPLTLAELFAAAWPGESAVTGSGDARVYVGISTLRRLGLREALVTHSLPEGTGYALHPTVILGEPDP